MATQNYVPQLYRKVVEDVIIGVRESFLDEGLDEQVLQELKQLWETKLLQSKAVDGMPPEQKHLMASYSALQRHAQQLNQPAGQVQGQLAGNTVFSSPMSNAAQTATLALPAGLYQQQIAALGATGGITLQQTSSGQFIAIQNPLPPGVTQLQQPGSGPASFTIPQSVMQASQQQQQQQQQQQSGNNLQPVIQLDGANDSSSDDDDDEEDNKDDGDDDAGDDGDDTQGEEENPLNSEDDDVEDDPETFDTDNVVVCQFDKINRAKNRWKFHLKDGIMNLNGRDYVFQKATGDAEW